MAITPIIKPLRVEGGTFYTFQPAMKDLTLMFGNNKNIQFNFSKFVCLNLPSWTSAATQALYADPNSIESINDNSELFNANTFFPKSYIQNYTENFNTYFDKNRLDNNFSNGSEMAIFKALSNTYFNSNPALVLEQSGTYLDFDNIERIVYKESSEPGFSNIIQYVGDINMLNNVKNNGDEYVEVYGHIPTAAGKTNDVQFIRNLKVNPTLAQIPGEGGDEWIYGQQEAFENSTENTFAKALYDTSTRKYNVSTDGDMLQIDWSDLDNPESAHKYNNGNFEFNAILLYYDIFDSNDQTTVSRNLYGILILDSFDTVSPVNHHIPSFKKYQPDENQSGNSFGFRFNLMFSNSSNIITTGEVINDDSTVSMSLYMEALEILKGVSIRSEELMNKSINVNDRLNKMESLILSISNATGERRANIAAQRVEELNLILEDNINRSNLILEELDDVEYDANQATDNANTAATNANDAATNANDAAANANDAATAANTAADFANSQRGWSPKFVFEEDGATRLVKKLDSWIGGTGTAPTDNVGMYVTDGGYTADKSLAENFKGVMGDNLLFEYVHSGNKEVYIDSIDYDTNTFTSVGHGLVNGDRLALNLLKQTDDVSQSPFTKLPVTKLPPGTYLIVDDITTDTFKVKIQGASIVFINESTVDLSFFRFEVVMDTILTFSEINANDIEVKVVGGFTSPPVLIRYKGEILPDIGFSSSTDSFGYLLPPDLWSLGGTYSTRIITNDKEEVRQSTWNLLQFDPMFNSGALNEILYRDNTQNSFPLMCAFHPYNGTTIKIYKL